VLLLALLLAGACAPLDTVNPAQQPAAAPTVTPFPTAPAAARTTYVVQRGTVQELLEFRGRWLPRDQIQLSFELAGTVRQVAIQRDDTVNVGTLLADLQIDDLENQLAQQQLQLQTAQQNLASGGDNDENSVTSAQFALANARLQLQGSRATLPWTTVQDALQRYEQAQRDVENAQRSYDDLVSRPDTPATQVDNAYEALLKARENVTTTQRAYQQSAAQYYSQTIQLQQQENQVLQNELNLQEALIGGGNPELVQAVQQAQLAVDQTQERIRQSSLFSPLDGVVLEVIIRPGDRVEAFNTVLTLAIPEPREAIANLAFNDIQRLSVGQVGICRLANQPDSAVQCIVRKLPLSNRDADQTVRVAAVFTGLASGQLVEIEMPLQVRDNVLWLPPAAVNEFQNRTFVVLQTADGERVRDVEIGLRTDDRIEITAGLNEGDIVIQQ
jgi:multidrug efflux pump subunit AcrA (membrane-fusion protein)